MRFVTTPCFIFRIFGGKIDGAILISNPRFVFSFEFNFYLHIFKHVKSDKILTFTRKDLLFLLSFNYNILLINNSAVYVHCFFYHILFRDGSLQTLP